MIKKNSNPNPNYDKKNDLNPNHEVEKFGLLDLRKKLKKH